jgi:hypothetical protein
VTIVQWLAQFSPAQLRSGNDALLRVRKSFSALLAETPLEIGGPAGAGPYRRRGGARPRWIQRCDRVRVSELRVSSVSFLPRFLAPT